MKYLSWLSLAPALFVMQGCSMQQTYPTRFDTISEVYSTPLSEAQLTAAPPNSRITATFDAPYADVFSVASRSVTQNQWNLHSTDEAAGMILATRTVVGQFRTPNGYVPVDRHYHYLIRIDEKSAGASSLVAVAKTQGACVQINRGAMGAMSFGISEASFSSEMKNCRDRGSKTTWADGSASAKSELDNLVILMRNNLIALGYE